jgi:hypothetical protein
VQFPDRECEIWRSVGKTDAGHGLVNCALWRLIRDSASDTQYLNGYTLCLLVWDKSRAINRRGLGNGIHSQLPRRRVTVPDSSRWSCPVSVDTWRFGNQAAVEASFS